MTTIYVYSIYNETQPNIIYIGSTNDIIRRLWEHTSRFKTNSKYGYSSKKIFQTSTQPDLNDIKIKVINELYILKEINKNQLYIENFTYNLYKNEYIIINRKKPIRTEAEKKEWFEANKNKMKEYNKKYYENNKIKLIEQQKTYNKDNKKEYNKQYMKSDEAKMKARERNKRYYNKKKANKI